MGLNTAFSATPLPGGWLRKSDAASALDALQTRSADTILIEQTRLRSAPLIGSASAITDRSAATRPVPPGARARRILN